MARGIIGSAFIAVKPDTKGFEAGARVGILGPLKKVAVAAAGVFAAVKVKDFLEDAVRGYADDVNQAYRATKIFGASVKTVEDFASSAADAFGLSDDEATKLTNKLGQLFVQMGIAPKRAADMSVGFTKLAVDMASFANVPVEDAAGALQRGLAGATRGLKQFGIVITDAQIKTEAVRLGLIKTVKDALTPATKAQSTYALILKQSGLVQGDFQKRSGDLRNTMLRLNAEWDDAKDKIGAVFLPIVLKVLGVLADNLPAAIKIAGRAIRGIQDAFSPVTKAIGGFIDTLRPIAAAAQYGFGKAGLAGAINAAAGALTQLVPQFEPIRAAIATSIGVIERWKAAFEFKGVEGLLEAIGGRLEILRKDFLDLSTAGQILTGVLVALGLALAAAFFPVTAIVVGLAALAGALVYAYKTNETFRKGVQAVGDFLSGPVLDAVSGFADSIKTAFQSKGFQDFAADVKAAVSNVSSVVEKVAGVLVRAFGPTILANLKIFAQTIATVFKASLTVIQGFVNIVVGLLSGDWSRAWEGVKQVVSGALTVVVAIFKGTLTTMKNTALALASAAGKAILTGLQAGASGLAALGEKLATTLANAIKTAPAKLAGLAGDLIGKLGAVISQIAGWAIGAAKAIGVAIGQGIINGIQSMAGAVASAAESLAHKAVSVIKSALHVGSPSRVMRDEVGIPIALGIADGMAAGVGPMVAGITRTVNAAAAAAAAPVAGAAANAGRTAAAGAHAAGKGIGQALLLGYLDGTRDLPDKIKDSLRNAIDRAKTVVENARDSLTTAFQNMADKAFSAFDAATQAHLDQIGKRFDRLKTDVDAALTSGLATSKVPSLAKAFAALPKQVRDQLKAGGDALKAAFDSDMKGIDGALTRTNAAIDAQLSQATDRINQWQKDSDAATDAWATGQVKAINDALAKTLAGIDAWDKQLTPTEALIQQQTSAHDASQAAQQLADAQQAVADAKSQLNDANAAGDDPAAILAAQKALGDAQRQLAEVQFQQQLAQEQVQAAAERAQKDAQADQQRTDAQTQAQAQIDQINAQADAERAAHAAAAAQQLADAQAQADALRAQAQAAHDAAAAARQAQYDGDQAALEAAHDKLIAELERQQGREDIEYQASRDLLREHLQARLAAIEAATIAEKNGWQKHHAAILKLFHDITGDYADAGRNLGSAFVKGLQESQGQLEGMAAKLAAAIAAYLKLHSPAKKGPLSSLDHWWEAFAPTLMRGLDTRSLAASTAGLAPPRGAGAASGGPYGAVGDPRTLRKFDQLIDAVKEHRDGDLTIVAGRSGGLDLDELAARVGG